MKATNLHPVPSYPEKEVYEASLQFLQTGEIADILLPCYNQHGEWLGETPSTEFVTPEALRKLAKITIPEERRSLTNENRETILLTSYIFEPSTNSTGEPVNVVPWHEIRGMCQITTEGNIHAPNLKRLNSPYGAEIEGLTLNMPVLEEAKNLQLTAEHISIPKLALVYHLTIQNCRHVEAPALKIIESLILGPAFSARFASLVEARGPIIGYAIREFTAPLLETVNPGAMAHDGLVLPEAWTIDTPSLQYVGKRLDASSAETFYSTDLKVEGEWAMHPQIKARMAMQGPNLQL